LKQPEFNYKDPVTLLVLAYGFLIAAGTWLIQPAYLGLIGLPFVVALSLKWGIKGGLAAALWAGGSVFLASGLAGNITANLIISILFYFIIASPQAPEVSPG